ncbi:hypothetical protein JCM10450v2_001215 [Rhodotorula kratochvilovae]
MGVPKLWEELEPAVRITSWAQLAAPAFERRGKRGFRLGVDVAQWLFHMGRMNTLVDADGNEVHPGANADLRMVFYRVCDFLAQGILAVFVFDGPHRPSWKRDRNVSGVWRGRSEKDIITMLELMGMEWRRAPGEAEAELAEMSRRGEVDAILSDDIDSLLFGVTSIIRNPGKGLSGNKSKRALARQASAPDALPSSSQPGPSQPIPAAYPSVAPDSDVALVSYSSADVASLAGLDRDQLILVALMSGADYDTAGIERVGVTISVALAKGGFAADLLDGIRRLRASPGPGDFPTSSAQSLERFLGEWRASVAAELRTNSRGLFSRREKKLADTVDGASAFPSLKIVNFYLHPRVSDPLAAGYAAPTWARELDLAALVDFAAGRFEWGNAEMIGKLRNKLWLGLALREVRRAALAADGGAAPASTSSQARVVPRGWLSGVHDLKVDKSTGYVPSYRVELSARVFDALVAGVLPARDPHPLPDYSAMDSDEERAARAQRKAQGRAQDPPKEVSGSTALRHWVPREVLEACEEGRRAVAEWKDAKERKRREKEDEAERKEERRRAREAGKSSPVKMTQRRASGSGGVSGGRRVKPPSEDDEMRREIEERKAKAAREEMLALSKGKGKGKASADAGGSRLRQPAKIGAPGLLSFGRSSKPGLSSTFTSTKPSLSSARAPTSKQADVFSSPEPPPPPPRPKPTKRAVRPPPEAVLTLSSTDESDNGAPARRKVAHVDKAVRPSEKARSPVKTRKLAPAKATKAAVLELLSSDDSGFAYDSDDALLARKGGTQPLESPEHESLADFMAKRRQAQERVEEKERQLQAGVLVLTDSD